jgi:hypothetical protein
MKVTHIHTNPKSMVIKMTDLTLTQNPLYRQENESVNKMYNTQNPKNDQTNDKKSMES